MDSALTSNEYNGLDAITAGRRFWLNESSGGRDCCHLVELYRPERIYLFGSAARDEAGPDSDYDFMVVVPDGTPRELRETKSVFDVLRDIDAPFDVLVWTRFEFNRRLHLRVSFPSTIVREGKLLYGA